MRERVKSVAYGFLGMLLALLAYQAYLDHQRIKQHDAAIQQIVAFINSATKPQSRPAN